MTTKKNTAKKSRKKSTVDFHYIKGPDFRSIHVDGAIGGLTTKGFLHIAMFAERAAIPQHTSFNVLPNGSLGDEILDKRESLDGVVRQMEVDLIINEQTALDLRAWLDERIEEFENRKEKLSQLEDK